MGNNRPVVKDPLKTLKVKPTLGKTLTKENLLPLWALPDLESQHYFIA